MKKTDMMQILSPLMRNLLENPHYEFKLIFGNDNRLRWFWLLALSLRATSGGSRARGGDGTLSTCTFSSSLFIVFVEPLFVSLIHVVGESISDAVCDTLFDGLRSTDICNGVLPLVKGIEFIRVGNHS